ncbi:low temperature requirement protein A [Micromonospora avicenniae]|uniref:Low temperature requirement protein LtrA n=1 Tax=Micromonospora avicenniae TaxID=1198245 RepID=A0A1N6VRG0_9ACTN|nr:low temperature requirement protein A [Micromonospora avicenniae]SIQ80441.1 Low temperature requirement protein LtrA [Micromonospora avicenniae]
MDESGGEVDSQRAFGAGGRVEVATHGGVTRSELFLDLVYVYAFINVTHLMAERPGLDGLLHGGLVVLLIWRSWAGYCWVGNLVRLDRGALPVAVFAVAIAILLVAVAIPEAFVDDSSGLRGPLVFVVGFLTTRVGSLLVVSRARRTDPRWSSYPARRAWLPLVGSALLLLGAVLLPHHLPSGWGGENLQLALFAVAIVVDYLGLRVIGTGTWHLTSVRHWAERHNLIMLVALGETIISIGTSRGFGGVVPITWSMLAGAALGLLVVAFLWWAYFDIASPAGEQALESIPPGYLRSRRARAAYTLLHLPMIGGLILVAFGLKKALGGTPAGEAEHWSGPDLAALYGGVFLYLLGLVAFEWRTARRIGRGPVLGLVMVALLIVPARGLTALESLVLLAGALVALVLAHVTVFRRRHRQLHRDIELTAGREVDATPEELFLDLVFVYAFIQVSALMARNPSALLVLQGLAVLALLWWSWVNYTWFTTTVRSAGNAVRLVVLAAVGLTLMLGIAAPQTFEPVPGGLPGALIVVTAYAAVRILHLVAFWWVLRQDVVLRAIVVRAAVPTGVGIALLLCAGLTAAIAGDSLAMFVAVCWALAIAVDVGGGYLIRARNWRLRSVSRWMGRYNLIILIALGQAVISTGIAAGDPPVSMYTFVAVALSAALISTLWWTYVGSDVVVGQRFTELHTSGERGALARDAYAYLHLFLVIGLVLVAFGLRTTLPKPGHEPHVAVTVGQVTLACGVVVYLLADHLIWRRAHRPIGGRGAANLVVAALAPVTILLPIMWALAALTVALFVAHLIGRGSVPSPGVAFGDGK